MSKGAAALMIGLICLIGPIPAANAQQTRTLTPRTKADYGSGATVQTDWYGAGGIPGGVGMFVGHPNSLTRSDRALVRFDLAPYLLPPFADVPIARATLTFRVEALVGTDDQRSIEVSALRYDPLSLGGFDTVNRDAEVVGTVVAKRATATTADYTLDVTRFVKDGLRRGQRYAGFRFRDVEAEAKGNQRNSPVGAVLHLSGPLPRLEIRESR